MRIIVVGGKSFPDHSLKAVTSCENSLKGEIKGIFNIDGLGWALLNNSGEKIFTLKIWREIVHQSNIRRSGQNLCVRVLVG